ncbi:unnamed protein product [Ranitomeya imitator]|uniref:ribonuclease H n=1 Tax=Ranitomeya imitator TaxID=111125 RepID=A0ABN9MIH3_9NEOB|nr:unnamed protein product [Ranitomeya imitator]
MTCPLHLHMNPIEGLLEAIVVALIADGDQTLEAAGVHRTIILHPHQGPGVGVIEGIINLSGHRKKISDATRKMWFQFRQHKCCCREDMNHGFSTRCWYVWYLARDPVFCVNLKPARELPLVLSNKIAKEVALGRMMGPFPTPPFQNLRVSLLGIVPKKEPGEFRLIHHLLHPKGFSVNDGIVPEEASVSYASFDHALIILRKAGPGAWMAKSDIASAFRLLPVHPDCYHFLGCFADVYYYYDTCLPMGCSISCKYFELFSSFLEWVVKFETGSQLVTHYLDDFLFVGPAESDLCKEVLHKFQDLMKVFGAPLSAEKTLGPLKCLSFPGIEIDSIKGVFRLPWEKIVKFREKK